MQWRQNYFRFAPRYMQSCTNNLFTMTHCLHHLDNKKNSFQQYLVSDYFRVISLYSSFNLHLMGNTVFENFKLQLKHYYVFLNFISHLVCKIHICNVLWYICNVPWNIDNVPLHFLIGVFLWIHVYHIVCTIILYCTTISDDEICLRYFLEIIKRTVRNL